MQIYKYVIVRKTDDEKLYRTCTGAWIEIKDKQTTYPLKSFVDKEDAIVSKNYIEHKEQVDGLAIENINIKQLGY
jgi:hypothetical protein